MHNNSRQHQRAKSCFKWNEVVRLIICIFCYEVLCIANPRHRELLSDETCLDPGLWQPSLCHNRYTRFLSDPILCKYSVALVNSQVSA